MTHFADRVRTGKFFPGHGAALLPGVEMAPLCVYNIVPLALNAAGIAAAQAVAGAGNLVLTSTVVTFDVPRAVSVTSSNAGDTTQTATVVGKDVYGFPMSEAIAFNGAATIAGKKAFSSVSSIAISAALAGNGSAGTLDVFGLPIFLGDKNYITAVKWKSVLADDASTVLAGVTTAATPTTGDVRGTVAPSDASDGVKRLTVTFYVPNPDTEAGIYGVAQA